MTKKRTRLHIEPLKIISPRRAAIEIHEHVRGLIVSGKIAPSAILSQADLSSALGVSRTPVREALRMLQEQGLVEAETNHRARVIGFDAGTLEALYCRRVMLESLGVALTAPRMSEAELDKLTQLLNVLSSDECRNDFRAFVDANRAFHTQLVMHSGAALLKEIVACSQRSELYICLSNTEAGGRWWSRPEVDHLELEAAFRARKTTWATRLIAQHLARTALVLLQTFAPEHEPVALRTALQIAMSAGNAVDASVMTRNVPSAASARPVPPGARRSDPPARKARRTRGAR